MTNKTIDKIVKIDSITSMRCDVIVNLKLNISKGNATIEYKSVIFLYFILSNARLMK